MSTQLRFGLFGQLSEWLSDRIIQIGSLNHYSALNLIYDQLDMIVLNPERSEQQLNWLQELRANSITGSQLIFTLTSINSTDAESSILLDGHWDISEKAEEIAHEYRLSKMMFKANDPDPFIQKTLSYLWTYKPRRLKPLRNWKCSQFYQYPILDCFAGNKNGAAFLLSSMSARKLLSPQHMFDRIRCCPSCNDSHLSYIDQCPTCASIDIVQQPAIHCFNCGHVAAQSYFRHQGVLLCPNCLTRLRHIGSDYDRPLEQFSCLSCHSMFIEADIRANCMSCGSSCQTDELQLSIIYDYVLSDEGKLLCSLGQAITELPSFNSLTLIPSNIFRFCIRWFDDLVSRDQRLKYSVMVIRMANVGEMVNDHGYQKTSMMIQALSERIRTQIRKTDLVTRTSEDLYLLLLLNADVNGTTVIKEKISSTLKNIQVNGKKKFRLIIASRSIEYSNQRTVDVELLLENLVNEVID
jgi:GGDEF domain-containing protein